MSISLNSWFLRCPGMPVIDFRDDFREPKPDWVVNNSLPAALPNLHFSAYWTNGRFDQCVVN